MLSSRSSHWSWCKSTVMRNAPTRLADVVFNKISSNLMFSVHSMNL